MPAILFMDEERSTHKNTDLRKEEILGYLKGCGQIYSETWN
jgi:hypothetical protein